MLLIADTSPALKDSLGVYYMPCSVLGTEDKSMNKTELAFMEFAFPNGERMVKH